MNQFRLRTQQLLWVLLILSALLVSGCDAAAVYGQLERMGAQNQQATTVADQQNRLLVLGADGNIYTMKPDGSNRLALTADASRSRQHLQPTWSPDAEQIAWATADSSGTEPRAALVTSTFNGLERNELTLPFAPFYISWSPGGERLAYLSSWNSGNQPSMALRLVDLAANEEAVRTLAEGQPFYFSWSPDGEQLLTHIGNERVELQLLDGTQTAVQASAANFPAPQWASTGDHLIYAVSDGGDQYLVRSDLAGEEVERITDYGNRISFTLSPDDSQLAYAITDSDVGLAALGPLYVVELETMRTREVSDVPVIAFFWSPDSEKLAYLSPERTAGTIRFRWHVWDGAQSYDYAPIYPTRTFLESYLTFFDQYAQSMTIWSPDSSAFAFAGIDEQDRLGIWVQSLDPESEPVWVTRGVYAAWSPR